LKNILKINIYIILIEKNILGPMEMLELVALQFFSGINLIYNWHLNAAIASKGFAQLLC
jgi:hypothetical protein